MSELPGEQQLDRALESLRPKELWRIFKALSRIPRESGNEEQGMRMVKEWAADHGFTCRRDTYGNLCVHVPANCEGCEDRPAVCLQGHMDMVCVKADGVQHDFAKDPILLNMPEDLSLQAKTRDVVTAKGTTLGADNGIGLAAAMAVATDQSAAHPPLQILITREEETGFLGVQNMNAGELGLTAASLISLDYETVSEICVRSAGAQEVSGSIPVETEEVSGPGKYYEIAVTGMPGGHSGVDINKDRGNAIRLIADLLKSFGRAIHLRSIEGGQAVNAIPASAKAIVFVPDGENITAKVDLANIITADKWPGSSVTAREIDAGEGERIAMTADVRTKVVSVLTLLINGVIAKDEDLPGITKTSANLGTVRTADRAVKLGVMARSSSDHELANTAQLITAVIEQNGGTVTPGIFVPGWSGDPDSKLAKAAARAYRRAAIYSARTVGVHGALEVGLLVNTIRMHLGGAQPIDAVSIGPTIRNPHSPSEEVDIESVEIFYMHLKEVLNDLTFTAA